MRDLIDFLYARFDEDSRVAQEAKTGFLGWLSTLSLRSPAVALQATYVMHWQPTRALDEIEAKRRRLDVIVNSPGVNREARRRLLLAEASPYYRHPEFRADWHNIDGDTGIPPAPQAPPPPAYAPQARPAVAPPGPPNVGPGSGPIPSPGYAQPGPMAPGHAAPDTLGSGQWRP
ncbi:MAG TPA: DUF6221 family protein [Streptosporangiaceae bacterium]